MDNVTLVVNIIVGVVSGLLTAVILGLFSIMRQAFTSRRTKAAPSDQPRQPAAESVSGPLMFYIPRLLGFIVAIAVIVTVVLTVLQLLGVSTPFAHLFGI